jgi:molecular chaperone GrpE (heat shock protein)
VSGGVSGQPLRSRHRRLRQERRDTASVSSEVNGRLEALEDAVARQAQSAGGANLGEWLERLEKQLSRAGREQFKANALADSFQKSSEATLDQLRDAAAHRERELNQMRDRLSEATGAGRLEVVQRLLPALDGLEAALASGNRLLQRSAALERPEARPSLWDRLNPARRAALEADLSASRNVAAWLEGLSVVQERLLEALAAADVAPIPTEGCAFDPHLHVAVETVPADGRTRSGDIVREHRRGYLHGGTIIRYAEVVVARAAQETSL